jgi:hypothetical protein
MADVDRTVETAQNNRKMQSTAMNDQSSRSHMVISGE